MLADLVRLILLILLLPIILILIGPLLILAVIRGYQPMGPIRLDTSRYGPAGRVGALILGALLWVLVWGGLAWLAINAFIPLDVITSVSPTVPTTVAAHDTLTPTPIPATPTLVSLVELTSEPSTVTPVIASDTPPPPSATPIPTASATPVSPTATPIPTASATPVSSTATPSSTPTFSPTPTRPPVEIGTVRPENSNKREQAVPTVTPTISPRATLSFVERQAIVQAVEEGNVLLQEAIVQGDEDNLQKMEKVWQDLAFRVAKNFAAKIHEQYAKPVEVQFEYVQLPTIAPQSSRNEVVVTSREKWAYGGPTKIDKEEIFDFIYTLTEKDGGWIITRYTYRNVSSPTSTSTPTSTATPDAQQ